MCKFCQFSHFILINYCNFESYQNMLAILDFSLLYHKLQLYLICDVHYTPFTCDKGLLNI